MAKKRTNIGILDYEFKRKSARLLFKDALKVGKAEKLDLHNVCLVGEDGLSFLHNTTNKLDVILPRFSTWLYHFGMIATRHFEQQGIPVVNGSKCIELCQNKYYTSLALKKKNINQPNFAIALSSKLLKKHVSHMRFPVVLKLLHGTEGIGTLKANDWAQVRDWIETLGELHKIVYVQDYLHHQEDFRLFVVGDEVVYGYKKILAHDEWKSNNHYRAKIEKIDITKPLKRFALKCANAVKAEVCAVDYALVNGVPYVMEMNQAPDFSNSFHINVSKKVIEFCRKKARR